MWIAKAREPSSFWTHIALPGIPGSTPVWVSFIPLTTCSWYDRVCVDVSFRGASHCEALKTAIPALLLLKRDNFCFAWRFAYGCVGGCLHINEPFWSQIRWEDPLNLSISLSGGKETNKDSPSNGEWTGKSSDLKSAWFPRRVVVWRSIFSGRLGTSSLEWDIREGENPVFDPWLIALWYTLKESGCLGMQP